MILIGSFLFVLGCAAKWMQKVHSDIEHIKEMPVADMKSMKETIKSMKETNAADLERVKAKAAKLAIEDYLKYNHSAEFKTLRKAKDDSGASF
jgi:hypothetical protein